MALRDSKCLQNRKKKDIKQCHDSLPFLFSSSSQGYTFFLLLFFLIKNSLQTTATKWLSNLTPSKWSSSSDEVSRMDNQAHKIECNNSIHTHAHSIYTSHTHTYFKCCFIGRLYSQKIKTLYFWWDLAEKNNNIHNHTKSRNVNSHAFHPIIKVIQEYR